MTESNQHTECFMCGRIFFDRVLRKCSGCGSASLRHYSTEDLGFMQHRSTAGPLPAVQVHTRSQSNGAGRM